MLICSHNIGISITGGYWRELEGEGLRPSKRNQDTH